MKNITLTLFFSFMFQIALSQTFIEKNFQITRMPLIEKFNLSARELPRLLIRAYCEGKIAAYYPYAPETACSYHEFASHFAVTKTQPVVAGDKFEDVPCPSSFCINKEEESLAPFCFYYDVIEDKNFNTQTSTEKHHIKYIRLIYKLERHGEEILYIGPVFNYDDVLALDASEYSLFNPKNDAARIGFKLYFEGRMFSGFPVGTGKPQQKTNPNKEKDKWHH